MLIWTVIFIIIATAAGILGFSGMAPNANVAALIIFFIFAPLSLIFLAGRFVGRTRPRG
jgi:uncharacterized membrane protein YtjA (UPF0391 family)